VSLSELLRPKPEPERPVANDSGLRERAPAEARRAAELGTGRKFWGWLFNGARPEPVPSFMGTVEEAEAGKVGICCSGGGIRSAAFSLGALQTLQEKGELRRAAYLAAVSGGSYIAAAISMVAKTGDGDSDPALLARKGPFSQGSPEEQYLRNRSSYMAPTVADKIYLVWRVVLGLLLNLFFISAPLIGIALILTGLLYAPNVPDLAGPCAPGCAADIPNWFWEVPLWVFVASAVLGFGSMLLRLGSEKWMRAFVVWATRLLIVAGVLALVLVGLPYLAKAIESLGDGTVSAQPSLGDSLSTLGAGFLALLAGIGAQLTGLLRSKQTLETAGKARKALGKAGSGLGKGLAYVAGGLVGPLLVIAIVATTLAVGIAQAPLGGGTDWNLVWIGLAILAGYGVIYFFVDLTTWSLHPFYKRRLSSAFALKRVGVDALTDEERRRIETVPPANPATDVGVAIERDYDKRVPLSQTALSETKSRQVPTLLICAAANVSDPGASPPGRPVTGFTFSAGSVGGPLVGAVRMWELESAFEDREEAFPDDPDAADAPGGPGGEKEKTLIPQTARKRRRRDLTLPAAVAMSGAAISPSMGKMTARPLTFLMALANVRLGVWVPNPRRVGDLAKSRWQRWAFARPRLSYLLCELLGRNRIGGRYLYVSDGGHYENLGLVELLRRGCSEIYCLDASGVKEGHAEYGALGEAITMARAELQVEIDFGKTNLSDLTPGKKTHLAKKDVITGTIRYPGGLKGRLVYVRNTMTEKATWDARAHQLEDPRFPHNSTVDQLYTDQKFEAYRVLGAGAAERAAKAMSA
jgi:hypothetical protein